MRDLPTNSFNRSGLRSASNGLRSNSIASGGRVGAGGLGAGNHAGSINQGPPVGAGGLGTGNQAGTIATGVPVGTGGLGEGNSAGNLQNGPRIGAGGLGAVSGNPGSVTRGGRVGESGLRIPELRLGLLGSVTGNPGAITQGGRVGEGGLRGNGLHGRGGLGATHGSPGSIRRPSSSGGLRTGDLRSGGLKQITGRAGKRKRPPTHVCCGRAPEGRMDLDVVFEFDEQGRELPPVVGNWRAVMNGVDWTPADWRPYADMPPSASEEITMTQATASMEQGYSACCEISFDFPSPCGRLLRRDRYAETLATAAGPPTRMLPDIPGTSLFPAGQFLSFEE